MKDCRVALRRDDVCDRDSSARLGQCERRPVGFWGGGMPCLGTTTWNGWPAVGVPVPDTRLWQYYCYCSLTVVTGISNSYAGEPRRSPSGGVAAAFTLNLCAPAAVIFFYCSCWQPKSPQTSQMTEVKASQTFWLPPAVAPSHVTQSIQTCRLWSHCKFGVKEAWKRRRT